MKLGHVEPMAEGYFLTIEYWDKFPLIINFNENGRPVSCEQYSNAYDTEHPWEEPYAKLVNTKLKRWMKKLYISKRERMKAVEMKRAYDNGLTM